MRKGSRLRSLYQALRHSLRELERFPLKCTQWRFEFMLSHP
jgi:hypothetical protein